MRASKEAPSFRFYSLCDKVWRLDVLRVAWQEVRRNGGSAGVDGETLADIESSGVERWLGELARDLKEGTCRPNAVRQVLIPKKQRGKFRPLGIPCVRDRVAQTAVMLVLSPIFEADLAPEQYAYRPGRSAGDAVKHVHRLLNRGHREVVDADLTDYFGQIPHARLIKSVARRISDGRVLGWIRAWLEMAVEEEDGRGGRRRTTRARRERKGTPQGAPIFPLLSNLYMRRFILGWKGLGYARAERRGQSRFRARSGLVVSGGTLGLFAPGWLFPMAPSKGAYTGLAVCMLFTLWAALTRVEMPNSQIPLLDPGAYNFPWMPMTIGMIGHVLVLGVGYAASRGTDGADSGAHSDGPAAAG